MTTNAFNRFRDILGQDATQIVTITSVNGDGTSNAQTLSGTNIIVKGDTVTAGQRAFIRKGEILRKAPTVSATNVNV